MTPEDYFNNHLRHRITLLITFRERFSVSVGKLIYINPASVQDLYRCSMDISMIMVRFFLEEMNIELKRKTREIEYKNDKKKKDEIWRARVEKFKVIMLTPDDFKDEPRINDIIEVLVGANRAVAHIDNEDVLHKVNPATLIKAIDFTEEKIKTNIYNDPAYNYNEIMEREYKDMNRESLNKLLKNK